MTAPDPLQIVAVLFGIVSVYLSVRENIWSWPTALVNVSLYFLIFRRERLYADMGLQVFYIAISLYGWYHWLFGGAGRTVLRVSRTPRVLWVGLPLLWVAGTAGLGTLLRRHTDAAVPFLDSGLTVGSLIAQWMMSRKYLENWGLWVVLDLVYIGMFLVRGLQPTAVQYGIFLLLAARGHVEWLRSWRGNAASDPVHVAV